LVNAGEIRDSLVSAASHDVELVAFGIGEGGPLVAVLVDVSDVRCADDSSRLTSPSRLFEIGST
jgi:hypothetical protein